MPLIQQQIGRLPVWKGYWVAGQSYKAKNRVTHLGSEFQAKREGVLCEPVTIINDGQTPQFNTADWDVITNGTDAYILHNTIPRIYRITETEWAALQADAERWEAFCDTHEGWYVYTIEDGYEPEPEPEEESSTVAADGTLTLVGVVSEDGVLTLNATIDENGVLTL